MRPSDPSSTENVMPLSAGTCATQRRPCVQTLLQRGRAERHTAAQGTEQLQVQRPGLSSAGSPSVPWLGPATGGTPASQHPTPRHPTQNKTQHPPKEEGLSTVWPEQVGSSGQNRLDQSRDKKVPPAGNACTVPPTKCDKRCLP